MSCPTSSPATVASTASQQHRQSQRETLANSQYAGVSASAYVDLLPKHRGRITESVLDEPEPVLKLSSKQPSLPRMDPMQPLRTDRQIRLYNALQLGGPSMVAYVLYKESEGLLVQNQYPANTKMLEDRDLGHFYLPMFFMSMPKEVLESLIKNTLAYDRIHNQTVGDFYNAFMRPGEYPGCYLNTLTNPGSRSLLNNAADEGKYLSTEEITDLIKKYRNYINDTDAQFNDLLDRSFSKKKGEWADNAARQDNGRAWCDNMTDYYVTGVSPANMKILHLRAPVEVGWTVSIKNHVAQHTDSSCTTPIFGFNNCITRLLRAQGGFAYSGPFAAALWPILERNTDVARIAEIGASALCSSYHWDGGYNSDWAGGFPDKPLQDLDTYYIDIAQQNMLERYQHCQAPDRWELESVRLAERLEKWKNRLQAKQAHEACKSNLKALYERLRASEVELARVTLEYKAKCREVEKAQEAIPASSQKYKGIRDKIQQARARARASARVNEEFKQRLRAEYPAHDGEGRYLPGPLVTLEELTEDEVKIVESRMEAFRLETASKTADHSQNQGTENRPFE
ncbi:MAG: hypothetical protein Q9184_005260 [Pyrenodesmia sp. 2 TL-2023]